jgi:predicted branched-subunit amino acid permease
MVIGVLPLGLAIGVAISSSTMPALAGWAAGPLIFGGAAQLMAIQLLDAGAAPAVVIVSALLVNSRIVMYSAAIAPWFRTATLRQRLLVAAPLIDPLYLTCAARYERGDLDQRGRLAYYTGAAVLLLAAWMAIQALAIAIGDSIPDAAGLHVAAPLAFAGMLAKTSVARPAIAAAAAAGLVAVTAAGMPYQSGITLAVIAGIVAGCIAEQRPPQRATPEARS